MADIIQMVKRLRLERVRAKQEVERLGKVIAVLGKLGGGTYASPGRGKRRRPKLSLAARRRIAAAQRARWAKWKAKQQKKAA